MPRMGLNRQAVVNAAIQLIEDRGYKNFSMRELAERLQIKTASLYNHIESIDALYAEIGCYVISKLKDMLIFGIGDKKRDEAVGALADAYYSFAKAHPELYRIFMDLPVINDNFWFNAAGDIVNLIIQVLSEYRLDEEQKMHLQRVLRSIIQGFIVQEDVGCLNHFPVDVSESFHIAVDCFLSGLHNMEKN
ncbi:MAG: TetR/AcrR family transcriptional regulator [Lachnospiraceae bacterium]